MTITSAVPNVPHFTIVFAAAVAMAVVLTGCGSPSAPGASSPPPSASSSPAATTEFLFQWVSGGGEAIWTMNGTGGGAARIPVDGTPVHPDWSPDGERVVYARDSDDGHRQIWVANIDGSDAAVVVPCADPCVSVDSPAWSPDGTQIAFAWYEPAASADGPPTSGSIRTVEIATGVSRIVTQTPALSGDIPDMPRWSPDGSALVIELDHFDAEGAPSTSIATVAAAGGSPTELTTPDLGGAYPDWSPDGERIVFCTYDISLFDTLPSGAASNIYTIAVDGSALVQLTDLDAGDRLTQPTWLRDGSGIVATLDQGGTRTGATLRADGGALARIGHTEATHVRERPRQG